MKILGLGAAGGFGTGVADLKSALAAGRASVPVEGAIRADLAPLDEFVPRRALRRTDRYARLALLGAHLALADAGSLDAPREGLGVIVGSGYGAAATTFSFLDSVLDGDDALASPTHFSNSVHNAAAAHLSMRLGATGPHLTVSQFETTFASALATARVWLAEGRARQVLVGVVDEYCDVLGYCYERFFGQGSEGVGAPDPLDLSAQQAVPGEGCAFFLLEKGDGEAPRGRVSGPFLGRGILDARTRERLREAGLVILGADGHRRCARGYARLLDDEEIAPRAVSYAGFWGSLPSGQGFDLAAASLCVSANTAFAAPFESLPGSGPTMAGAPLSGPVACYKAGPGNVHALLGCAGEG